MTPLGCVFGKILFFVKCESEQSFLCLCVQDRFRNSTFHLSSQPRKSANTTLLYRNYVSVLKTKNSQILPSFFRCACWQQHQLGFYRNLLTEKWKIKSNMLHGFRPLILSCSFPRCSSFSMFKMSLGNQFLMQKSPLIV